MGSANFSFVQFNGGIQLNVLMCIVDKTTGDKMLKFLEEVKLGFIFTPAHLKIGKEKDLAKNLEKPHTLEIRATHSFLKKKLSVPPPPVVTASAKVF